MVVRLILCKLGGEVHRDVFVSGGLQLCFINRLQPIDAFLLLLFNPTGQSQLPAKVVIRKLR